MDESGEQSNTTSSTDQNSNSSEKSLVSGTKDPMRPGRGRRLPWEELKVEYLCGNEADVSKWGRAKNISINTLAKNTVGWPDEYRKRQEEIAKKAISKIDRKQTSALASRIRAGRILVSGATREILRRGEKAFKGVEVKKLADIVSIGAKVQHDVEAQTTQEQIEKLQAQIMSTQVTVTTGNGDKGEKDVRTEIKLIARSIARGGINSVAGMQSVLGSEADSGSQQ